MAVLSDGRIISGSADHTIRIWNSVTGKCVEVVKSDNPRYELLRRIARSTYDSSDSIVLETVDEFISYGIEYEELSASYDALTVSIAQCVYIFKRY